MNHSLYRLRHETIVSATCLDVVFVSDINKCYEDWKNALVSFGTDFSLVLRWYPTACTQISLPLKITCEHLGENLQRYDHTYVLKLIRPPSAAMAKTCRMPPSRMLPWIKSANRPANMMVIWKASVQITAFIPPWKHTRYMYSITRYHQTSHIIRTLVGNETVDHSDVVGASPVGAAPTTSSFST